ncbi:MAG: AarF/ABC1/UbiB kinase family protein, partial [Ilumatobacteraceae bacterium]
MTSPVHTSSSLPNGAPVDMAWGAFHETAPWTLHLEEITWQKVAAELRAQAQREIPVLTTPTRTPPVARLVTVVWVLGSALLPWFVKKKFKRFATPEESRAYVSLRMRKAVERLGSTYIKLGQIISSGEGLFPAE